MKSKEKLLTLTMMTLAALMLMAAPAANAEVVKKSRSDICHDQRSRFYERTKNFEAFSTIEACLESGGRLPKGLSKSPSKTTSGYARSKFGHGWDDADRDCQNTRAELLIDRSVSTLQYANEGCRVTHGKWTSPFTGKTYHDASELEIDHVVALKFAWDHGADKWSRQKRERFANDPANLLAVEAGLNSSKAERGIGEWLPPANQCAYILQTLRIQKKYGVEIPESKQTHYQKLRQHYCRN